MCLKYEKKNQPENAFSPLESCHLYMYPWCRAPAGNRSLKISRARPSLQKEKLPKPIRLSSPVFCILKKTLSDLVKNLPPHYFSCLLFLPFRVHSTCDFQKKLFFFFFTQMQLVPWLPSQSAQEPLAVWSPVSNSVCPLCLDSSQMTRT